MCPSLWFRLRSVSVLLLGRFSPQIWTCSRLAARGQSEPAPVAARGDVLTQPRVRGVLQVCSPQSLDFPVVWRSPLLSFSPLCGCSTFLSFGRSNGVLVGWRQVFSWALRLLSHSVKLLWRGLEAVISKSRPNDNIVGWFLCLVPPGYVDLVLVCMFVLVILGVVSVL
ncbi:unnamed protein product [Brassica rapa]|uniref:Uncharacterized protein n=1 Tax=Brassica campestris TaxID=3711 RepID=A0A8D9M0H6_BRACM|nr:unnamed protein product [Brassica rapa]